MITHLKRAVSRASVKIEDDNWTVHDSGDATLYLKEVEIETLDASQKQAELVVTTDDGTATIDLSSENVDALADALHTVQGAE